MGGAGRLLDYGQAQSDAHGCPLCPHPMVTGPAILGSFDVIINGKPALRQDDIGIHAVCCAMNMWTATKGAPHVNINGKPAHRLNDQQQHCGGVGKLVEGSANVIIGDGGGGGGGGSGGGGSGGTAAQQEQQAPSAGTPAQQSAESRAVPPSSEALRPAPAKQTQPEPVLVSARWSKTKSPFGEKVTMMATCGQLPGQTAHFQILDDDDERAVGSASGTCGDVSVSAEWQAPAQGPPHEVIFKVAAGGIEAKSDVLTLTRRVAVKLLLDGEPAADVGVTLMVKQSGQRVRGRSDADGNVMFEEAPSGDWTLILDDEG